MQACEVEVRAGSRLSTSQIEMVLLIIKERFYHIDLNLGNLSGNLQAKRGGAHLESQHRGQTIQSQFQASLTTKQDSEREKGARDGSPRKALGM